MWGLVSRRPDTRFSKSLSSGCFGHKISDKTNICRSPST